MKNKQPIKSELGEHGKRPSILGAYPQAGAGWNYVPPVPPRRFNIQLTISVSGLHLEDITEPGQAGWRCLAHEKKTGHGDIDLAERARTENLPPYCDVCAYIQEHAGDWTFS
tara:strand:+ start:70 stop:405 length:336 start_codon:yes stop_codon:yes gene_type:complete